MLQLGRGGPPTPIGAYLRGRLAERGQSLRACARVLGVSHSTISRLVRGEIRPSPALLLRLARWLGERPGPLFARAGLPEPWDPGVGPLPAALVEGLDAERLRSDLLRLAAEAVRPAGEREIAVGFEAKLGEAGAAGPVAERLRQLHALYRGAPAGDRRRGLAGGALLYFIRAGDRIDDALFPYGYVDDAVVAELAWREIQGPPAGPG